MGRSYVGWVGRRLDKLVVCWVLWWNVGRVIGMLVGLVGCWMSWWVGGRLGKLMECKVG